MLQYVSVHLRFVRPVFVRELPCHVVSCSSNLLLRLGRAVFCVCDRSCESLYSLKKHAHSNILKILSLKNENFQTKNDIFHISPQNIDCGYSLESPLRFL